MFATYCAQDIRISWKMFATYCAQDIRITQRIRCIMLNSLSKWFKLDNNLVIHPLSPAFAKLYQNITLGRACLWLVAQHW